MLAVLLHSARYVCALSQHNSPPFLLFFIFSFEACNSFAQLWPCYFKMNSRKAFMLLPCPYAVQVRRFLCIFGPAIAVIEVCRCFSVGGYDEVLYPSFFCGFTRVSQLLCTIFYVRLFCGAVSAKSMFLITFTANKLLLLCNLFQAISL